MLALHLLLCLQPALTQSGCALVATAEYSELCGLQSADQTVFSDRFAIVLLQSS